MSNNSISNSTITTAASRFQGNASNNGNGHTGHRQDTSNASGGGHNRNNNNNNGNNGHNGNNGRNRPSDGSWRSRTNSNGDNTQTRNRPPPNSDRDRESTKPKFSGATDGMQGNIFGCSEEHGDRRKYSKTIAALQHHTSTFPNSEDFQSLFKTTPTSPTIEEPEEPKKSAIKSEVKTLIFQEEVKYYVKRKTTLRSNLVAIWNTVIGQCTDLMKSKLESYPTYTANEDARDCTWLLTTILAVTLQFDNRRYPYSSLLDAYHKFFSCRQSPNQSVDDYRQNLILWSDVIKKYGGTLVFNNSLTSKTIPNTDTPRTSVQRTAAAKQEILAMALLRGSDATRYGSLLLDLANNFAAGRDNYPKDVIAAYSLLIEYKTPVNAVPRAPNPNPRGQPGHNPGNNPGNNNSNDTATTAPNSQSTAAPPAQPPVPAGVIFTQAAQSSSATASTAPPPAATGTTLAHWAAMMAQHDYVIPPTGIDPSWILLDSQSTMSVFNNNCFLTDIHPAPHPIEAIPLTPSTTMRSPIYTTIFPTTTTTASMLPTPIFLSISWTNPLQLHPCSPPLPLPPFLLLLPSSSFPLRHLLHPPLHPHERHLLRPKERPILRPKERLSLRPKERPPMPTPRFAHTISAPATTTGSSSPPPWMRHTVPSPTTHPRHINFSSICHPNASLPTSPTPLTHHVYPL